MACSVWTDGYKLRVEDVGYTCLVISTFPIQPFRGCFLFPWLQEKLYLEKGAQTCLRVVELRCGLGRELGDAIKWAKLGAQTINSFNYPAGCGQSGL